MVNGQIRNHDSYDHRPVLPPNQFEMACAQVFLQGIDYPGYVALIDAGSRLTQALFAEAHDSKDATGHWPKTEVERSRIESHLDRWRPLLRPAYRDIRLSALRSLAETALLQYEALGQIDIEAIKII